LQVFLFGWILDPRLKIRRTHTREQTANIARSTPEFGWTNPVLVGAEYDIIASQDGSLPSR